jgi:hypothetical protein
MKSTRKRSKPTASFNVLKMKPSYHNIDSTEKLAQLQNIMAQTIMRPLTPAYQMRKRWIDGRSMNQVADTFIKANDRLTSSERLEIYNRQYWFRILDSFYDDFPGVHAILGDRRFKKLALAYLHRYPSTSFTLRNLGSKLVLFLEEDADWIGPLKELTLDMARLEWAHIHTFDEAQLPPVNPETLKHLDPQSIQLALQPYLCLLALKYPVDDLRIDLKKGNEQRVEASNAVGRDRHEAHIRRVKRLKPKNIYLVIHRLENMVYYKRLEAQAFHLLTALQSGISVGDACDQAFAGSSIPVEKQSQSTRQWFHDWSSFGWFIPSNII